MAAGSAVTAGGGWAVTGNRLSDPRAYALAYGGAFTRGHNGWERGYPKPAPKCGDDDSVDWSKPWVLGGAVGAGQMGFITNANKPEDFQGVFRVYSLNLPVFASFQVAIGSNGRFVAAAGKHGEGASISSYCTNTIVLRVP